MGCESGYLVISLRLEVCYFYGTLPQFWDVNPGRFFLYLMFSPAADTAASSTRRILLPLALSLLRSKVFL